MVDKIIRKDKNYNIAVAKVAEKETKKEVLQNEIKKLELEYQELLNKSKFIRLTLAPLDQNNNIEQAFKLEEEEKMLIQEEQEKMDELRQWQEKHTEVKLVHEKVIDNIKNILKLEKKGDDTLNHSMSGGVNDSKVLDNSTTGTEEDALRMYNELLEALKKRVDGLILNQTHDQFKEIMREKGYEPAVNKPRHRANKSDDKLFRELHIRDEIVYERDREEDECNILKAREEIIRDYHRAKEKERLKGNEPRGEKK
jgi:hypothetical protein